MWLLFDESGNLQAYSKRDEEGPAGAVVVQRQAPIVEMLFRLCERGRISYAGGQLQLDGQPFAVPANLPTASYRELLQAIQSASTLSELKAILRRLVLMLALVDREMDF